MDNRRKLTLFISVFLGVVFGLGLYILYVSNAVSYMSDKPEACINCHIMGPQFATWSKSSHARVTTCNSCHVPQNGMVRKYTFKALDGLYHSTIFTLGWEPEVIKARTASKQVIQENCQQCHHHQVQDVSINHYNGKYCWECHREVPHGRVRSLSSTPYSQVPFLKPTFETDHSMQQSKGESK